MIYNMTECKKVFLQLSPSLKFSTNERKLREITTFLTETDQQLNLFDSEILKRATFIVGNIFPPKKEFTTKVLELFEHQKNSTAYYDLCNDAFILAAGSNSHNSNNTMQALVETNTIDLKYKNYESIRRAAANASYQAFRIFDTIPNVDFSAADNAAATITYRIKESGSIYSNNANMIWRDFLKDNQQVLEKAAELGQKELIPEAARDIFLF